MLIKTDSQPLLPSKSNEKKGKRKGKRSRASSSWSSYCLPTNRRQLWKTLSLLVCAYLIWCLLLLSYYLISINTVAMQCRSSVPFDPFAYGRFANDFYSTKSARNNATNGSKDMKWECKLPMLDPCDSSILPYLDPTYNVNWRANCKRNYPALTQLSKGRVLIHPEAKENGTHCQFKCLYPETGYKLVEGAWKEVSEKPDCDIVETRCQHERIQNNEFYYSYLHAQIYRRDSKAANELPLPATPRPDIVDVERTPENDPQDRTRAPDVHVFVIDSLSHAQLLRTMPKTVAWLRDRMGAIPFPHLNKIGLNSRPNAYGMFLGIQVTPVGESPMGEGYTPPRDIHAMAQIFLDNESFVGFEYTAKGYRTMMAEDWDTCAFNWPNITGFERKPTDHYMRPFQLRTEKPLDPNKKLKKIVYERSCLEM